MFLLIKNKHLKAVLPPLCSDGLSSSGKENANPLEITNVHLCFSLPARVSKLRALLAWHLYYIINLCFWRLETFYKAFYP